MKKPAPIFRVTIDRLDHKIALFNDHDEALKFVRHLMEASGNCVFMHERQTDRFGSFVCTWMEWTGVVPRVVHKCVTVANTAEIRRYETAEKYGW